MTEDRAAKFERFCARYEVTGATAKDLAAVLDYNVVFVFDDSGSMNNPVAGASVTDTRTRWDELKETARVCIDFGTCLDTNGVDVFFLNRSGRTGVRDLADVDVMFVPEPAGGTPIVATLDRIVRHPALNPEERRLLIVLFTDGVPTTTGGRVDVDGLRQWLKTRHRNVAVSIVACSDEPADVSYLNTLDGMPGVDVTDDFRKEQAEALRAGRPRYTLGDHYVKAILGPLDKRYDAQDGSGETDCCVSCAVS